MKFLVLGTGFKNLSVKNIINCLTTKYFNSNELKAFENLEFFKSFKFDEKDFIKTGDYTYIYTNEQTINELLKFKIHYDNPFYKDNIEQVLYLETKTEYIPYLKIHQLSPIQILENFDKPLIIPDFNKNLVETFNQKYKRTSHIYAIEFDKNQYIKNNYNKPDFIQKLEKIDNIIDKYDCLIYIRKQFFPKSIYQNITLNDNTKLYQTNINYTYLLVLQFYYEYDNIVEVIDYLKDMLPEKKDLITEDNIIQQDAKFCYLIKDQHLINTLINTEKYSLDEYTTSNIQENYEFRYKDVKSDIWHKLLIKIDEKYVDNVKIIESCSIDIVKHIKKQFPYILPNCYNYKDIFNDLQSDSSSSETKIVMKGIEEGIYECAGLYNLRKELDKSGVPKEAVLFFDYV